jgi:hypothetical protein
MATAGPLPTEPGKPTFIAFSSGTHHAIFRVESLNTNVEILRQDREHWRKRTRAITAELLKRRAWLKDDGRRLAVAAHLLREPQLINDLREKLQGWIDQGEDEIKRTGFPRHLVSAIAALGDSRDVRLLEQIAQWPKQASYVAPKIAELTRRVGPGPAEETALPHTPDNRAAVRAQYEVSRTRNFMLYGFKVDVTADSYWPVSANVGVVNARFDEVKKIEKDISDLIHKRLNGLAKDDIATLQRMSPIEKEILDAINAKFPGGPVRHVYLQLDVK